MADTVVTLLWVQVGSASWLAFILFLVYLRVYREPSLRFWSLSYTALALSLLWQLAVQPPLSEEVQPWPAYLLGLFQFPLIALAAINLTHPVLSRRRQWIWFTGLLAGALVLCAVTSVLAPNPLRMVRVLRFERQIEGAAASAWFSIAFWQRHRLARTLGGRATALFTACYALRHLVMAVLIPLLPPHPTAYSIVGGVTGALVPLGVAVSMIILASEAMIATTRKLRDSEERYRTVVEASPDGIIATDPAGLILMCNRRAAEAHGFSASADIVGKPSSMLIAPADRERVRIAVQSTITEAAPAGLECQILRNGLERSAELTAAPLRSGDGAIAGSVTIVHDITARKEADRALRREREFSAHVIDAIPGIFFVLDRQGNFLRWNPGRDGAGSSQPQRIREIEPLIRFHPEDRARVAETVEAVFASGSGATEARGYAGSRQDLRHFYLTGRRMEADGAEYLVGCGVDITERKEAEAARARLESQLAQSRKLESIGRLAGGVAHDFNNHLTVINGYCDLMVSSLSLDDHNREFLLDVRQAGERAATLTRQLLAFGRKQYLSPRPVSLNRIVSSMETMLRRLVPENISVVTRLAPGLGAAMADTSQIEQVLMNLVVNARDAMPDGGSLLISTGEVNLESSTGDHEPEIGPGAYATLSVADTGVGMDESTRALIFEPFFTTKRPGQGTGLGLATVYGIVKQSGGAIAVRSRPGEGSVFTVYLRRSSAAATETPPTPAVEGTRPGEGTILLVEDQETVRDLVSRVLRSSGYSVIPAGDGSQALALADAQSRSIDLLITDVVMPGMSGRELAARMTASRARLRVLFISGYEPQGNPDAGVPESGAAYLQKPFSPAQITARVGELLAGR